ncbi:tetratricopeptide repeat protein [Siminovitchia fortis]|nr:tetratricopeptide repeat protein [Siminovitchia fortis]WHY82480.1 tetratricopeptide repeat protein [Siminovitchia fortis]
MEKDNIILFPGLKKRLFQFGMESLKDRQFEEAAHFFEQARELDHDDDEIDMALAVAYYESGDYQKAKEKTEDMLHKGIGDYYEIIDLYLMILMQLNMHEQVVHTLETLFEEQHVPPEKREHYQTLLKFSKRTLDNKEHNGGPSQKSAESGFGKGGFREQLIFISGLANKNIQPYKASLLNLLKDSQAHPFLQTAALNVLREHQVQTPVQVKKFDYDSAVIPSELPDLMEMPLYQAVIAKLNEELENENPVLLEQLEEMILRHQFLLFPFEFTPSNPALWAAAYRGFGHEMYGENWSNEKTAKKFQVDPAELDQAISFVFDLEQHSPSTV